MPCCGSHYGNASLPPSAPRFSHLPTPVLACSSLPPSCSCSSQPSTCPPSRASALWRWRPCCGALRPRASALHTCCKWHLRCGPGRIGRQQRRLLSGREGQACCIRADALVTTLKALPRCVPITQDEVRVLVRCNTIYFTSGYLGHLAVWILDTIRR